MITIEYADQTFDIHDIKRLPNIYRVIDPISYNLEYDTFNFAVKSDAIGEQKLYEKYGLWLATHSGLGLVVDNGDFADFEYGDVVRVKEDGTLKAVFYVVDIYPTNERDSGDELFHLSCVSSVGLLARMVHRGGIYVGVTAGTIIASIMGDLPYTIDTDVSNQLLYGWLPYTKDSRKNLNKVLFATGASMLRNSSGNVHFAANQPDIAKQIPKNRTFYGGILEKKERKSSITVIEHGFYQSDETEEELLYDNTTASAALNYIIPFDEPYYDYRGDGLTVVESGANWCKVTGVGYLYAKKYMHLQREVTQSLDVEGVDDQLRITDQTLVSSLNVAGVVERLANYYQNAKIRTTDIEVDGENPGDLVQFDDRRGKTNLGYIKSLDETASSFWRATAEIVTNWTPTKSGNDFENYLIVTGSDLSSGTWSVPPALRGKRSRIVLFSGAEGGQGGYAGASAGKLLGGRDTDRVIYRSGSTTYYAGALGDEQAGGAGGAGGKGGTAATKYINIDIDSLANSYPVSFGAGGEGGAGGTVVRSNYVDTVTLPEDGQPGGNSVFNGISTANGATFRGIYVNLITGTVLAQAGVDGVAGGSGGKGGKSEQIHGPFAQEADATSYSYASVSGTKGQNGSSVGSYAGGAGASGVNGEKFNGNQYSSTLPDGWYLIGNGGGGGGGGAAMGSAGSAGVAAYPNSISYSYSSGERRRFFYINDMSENDETGLYTDVHGAAGGDGADASIIPTKPLYVGGSGGHGGGGGGGAGQCMGSHYASLTNSVRHHGQIYGGKGGNGGKGGSGSDGFMIVYY